ncbi:Extended synaptotagmin-2-A [Larimichthys crocea]|uniref:Uncharacterized protein n=1 Tax=Larimichthys crocea TaxID=215358 RepID=A0ACD3QS33_LARCR|nr:Extended synaptotagmin-2-A [Larimichthys crocea]
MSNRMEGSSGPGVRTNGPIAAPSTPVSSIGPPLSPEELDEEPQSALTDVTQMWIKFGKTFAIIFPIYILGYFEFSFSWVLIGLAMLFYWRKNHGGKDYRINRALAFLEHEEKVVKQSVPTAELPPWTTVRSRVFARSKHTPHRRETHQHVHYHTDLEKHGAQQQPPGPDSESFTASTDAAALSSCHVCRVMSQQAYLFSSRCVLDNVHVTANLTHNSSANDVRMCEPVNSAD